MLFIIVYSICRFLEPERRKSGAWTIGYCFGKYGSAACLKGRISFAPKDACHFSQRHLRRNTWG